MIVLDTGSGDPDDILTIAYLADKDLAAITLHPGSDLQVGLVRSVLRELGLNIPVGGTGSPKNCVSPFYQKVFKFEPEKPSGANGTILKAYLNQGAQLLTCDLPKNQDGLYVEDWWAQGGFAGDSVMGSKPILEKFKGLETCQSFNFSNRRLIERCILNSDRRHFISKNICHGAIFDKTKTSKNPVIQRVMDIYLQEHDGKAFHDLLAAWAMLNPDGVDWAEVEIYYEQNKVGSRLVEGTNTFISTGYDVERFWSTI